MIFNSHIGSRHVVPDRYDTLAATRRQFECDQSVTYSVTEFIIVGLNSRSVEVFM